jgi:hypothetical protein
MISALRGGLPKSKAPASPLARASRRVSDGTLQLSSMNLRIEVWSRTVLSTAPSRAYGLTKSAGTLKPRPCGGRTWSYQPPHSS